MKKVIKLVLTIFVLLLFFEFIAFIFKSNHTVNYEIENKNHKFSIKEVYKNQMYYVLITSKKYKYSFEIENHFYKKKKIVSKIIEHKNKDYLCIYPVVKNSDDTNIMCSKDKKTYAYVYNQKDLKNFVTELKDKGYSNNSWKKNSNYQTKLGTLKIYSKNINEDTYIYIYKYNGFYSINRDKNENVRLFKDDHYNNTLGTIVNKYYIIPNYDQKYDYQEFYRINMKNNKIKTRTYKYEISKDSYLNGVIDNEIYIFDKDELKQYKIYRKGKKIKEVGNKQDGILYYNLGFKRKNAYTFRDEEITFKTFKDYLSKVEQNTSLKYIKNNKDTYYYQTNNNDVYYYNTNNKQKVLLFNKKIADIILIEDTIYFISGDTLYSYNNNEGLKKIVIYSELEFNPKNRISIYAE